VEDSLHFVEDICNLTGIDRWYSNLRRCRAITFLNTQSSSSMYLIDH
jgi:hypothetical protein